MSETSPLRAGLLLLAASLVLLGLMAAKGLLIAPPTVDEARTGFDAHRAAAPLARILGDERPHPVDSPASDAVRARLVAEMRAVGLEPRMTDDLACNGFARSRTIACARVRNLVATIGPSAGRHLLLSAHYDSTFAGPGAADAGIGVATLLETAAHLRGQALARPVTFLFNEGEEMGLIGARAFVERDPLTPRVDTLLNFEARGVEGPAIMFETSRPTARPVALLRAVDRPVANSLSTDLYRLIPNSTDVAVFEGQSWTILNFAVIGNETRYHSAGDNLAALDRRSLQHMGDQALALTRHVASGASPSAGGDRLYADLAGRQLVVLPMMFGFALLGLLILFFLVETGRRRAFGRPLLAVIGALAGSAVLAWLGQSIVSLLRAGDWWRGHPIVTEIAVYGSALAAGFAALALLSPKAGIDSRSRLRAAFWLTFLVSGAAIAFIAPGGAVYFLLPPLLAALGMAGGRWRAGVETPFALLAWAALFLTFGPSLDLFEQLMSNGPHWMFAPIAAAILLPALIELEPLARRLPKVLLLAAAGDLLLLPWGAAALAAPYSEDRQQHFTIEYVADAAAGAHFWAVNNDGRHLPYPGRWQRRELPHSSRPRWVTPAPAAAVSPPRVELIDQAAIPGGRRRLRLRLHSQGAETLTLVAPAEAGLAGGGAPGFVQAFRGREGRYFIRCIGRSCDGSEVTVLAPARPLELRVIGTRSGLPPGGQALTAGRPPLARPQYAPDSTVTIARLRI
jgi:hypothetical protein